MSNLTFVVAAFAVTWIALVGYLVRLRRVTNNSRALLERATTAANR
jgi:CcmD family protein